MPRSPGLPLRILLVEDSPADVLLAEASFKESQTTNEVIPVNTGEAALRFLKREAPYGGQARPDLILLDLNLPTISGWEVLAAVKRDPDLNAIPVVVLTTSADEQDVRNAYGLQANCYVTKPMGFDDFQSTIRAIENFWLVHATLPRSS